MPAKKGVKLSKEHRLQISTTMVGRTVSEESRRKRSEAMKKKWAEMTPAQREKQKANMIAGFQKSAKEGSRVEKSIAKYLIELGIVVDFHPIIAEGFEVDMFLPQYDLILEIDGPTHHMVVFNEEVLERNKKNDTKKNRLMAGFGYKVMRVRFFRNKVSEGVCRMFADWLKANLPSIIKSSDKIFLYDLENMKDISHTRVGMFGDVLLDELEDLKSEDDLNV